MVTDDQEIHTRGFLRIPQPSQPSINSICRLGGDISGGLKVRWERILRIPSAESLASLQEKIALIRTDKGLSRNLKSAELEKGLTPQSVRMGSSRIQPNTGKDIGFLWFLKRL
jgi:hypothetical protein